MAPHGNSSRGPLANPNKPVKVCLILGGMGVGGGEKYVLLLAEHLSGPLYSFHFVTHQESLFCEEARRLGYPVTVIDMTKRFNPVSLYKLTQFFKQERINLVHTLGARMNFYGRLAGHWAGVPSICSTVVNSILDYPIGVLKRALYVNADAWTARTAQRIIAVAEALGRDLRDKYGIPAEKILTIHNGIDLATLAPTRSREAIRAELGIPAESPCVGAIGRMTHQKGFTYLLQALPSLSERFPATRCIFVGDGPLRHDLQGETARLGLFDRCTFTGYRFDLPDLFQAMDVFILPSLSEGLPFVLLEAMGMGRPVVATAVSGNPEVIEHGRTGLLVSPADPLAITKAAAWLLEHPAEAEAMGQAARSVVEQHFTVTKMVEQTEEVYRSMWNNPR
ncbi:glycosyltransferase family 4 protein [Nitrospinae bacterium AH_259_B05_G02_I21]|nr:glycosyltransferase family 4 protein [Nitrospinae bacterium AH_259_B05_G02_I21]